MPTLGAASTAGLTSAWQSRGSSWSFMEGRRTPETLTRTCGATSIRSSSMIRSA
jgi:hypothetical protein